MSTKRWPRRDPIKNYFPLPNELYSLGLSHSAIAIYGFLLRRENRKTWQCVLSYRTIGEAVHLSVNTVRKYVAELEDRQLIRTERTTVITGTAAGRTAACATRYRPSRWPSTTFTGGSCAGRRNSRRAGWRQIARKVRGRRRRTVLMSRIDALLEQEPELSVRGTLTPEGTSARCAPVCACTTPYSVAGCWPRP